MFKDYEKYLSTSLKVYLFVLIIIFILKIVGLDYFGVDIDNPIIINIDEFILKHKLENVYYALTLYVYTLFLISIICDRNDRVIKIISIFITFLGIIVKYLENLRPIPWLVCIIDFSYFFIIVFIINRKKLLKYIKLFALSIFYQLISLVIRNINYISSNTFTVNTILDLDYILMLMITYKIYFSKGVDEECITEVGSFSLKKINLKKSLQQLRKKFQSNLKKFKKKDRVERLTICIYIILSLLWNTLSVVLVLFVAKLNDTFVECVFILTSFWLSKRSFGKAFHFDSMIQCFVVSNLTYYLLNRLTTPLGISIFIPILLGVGLSYVTSKFVKKSYKPLYRGMPEDVFEDTIEKVVEKNSLKYKICREFYIDKVSDVSLSFKYNYSVAGIRKIKDRTNDKIKKLN